MPPATASPAYQPLKSGLLSVGHININRLLTHHNSLDHYVSTNHFDVVAITETFLMPTVADTLLKLQGFTFLRHDRLGKEGGGIGLYVRDVFRTNVVRHSDPQFSNSSEYLIAELSFGSKKLLVAVVYCRPSAAFPQELFENIAELAPNFPSIIITGDFNTNMAAITPASTRLSASISAGALYLVPSPPTHHATYRDRPSHTSLDLFILNNASSLHSYHKSSSPFAAGHDFIHLHYKFCKLPPVIKTITTRSLNSIPSDTLASTLTSNLSDHLLDDPSLCISLSDNIASTCPAKSLVLAVNKLSSAITSTFDTVAPIRTITISSSRKPWVTADIRHRMHDRDRAYKRAKRTGNIADFERFKSLRRAISNDLNTAKNRHFAHKLSAAPNTVHKWREIRKLSITGSNRPSPLSCFTAAALNTHYAAASSNAQPPTLPDLASPLPRPSTAPPARQFSFAAVSQNEVSRVIRSSTSKATGPDGISAEMLKLSITAILSPLTQIFNYSFRHATFPDLWKRAFLSTLAQTAVMASMSDTRPIAKLSKPSKTLERLAHEQLSAYLESGGLLDPRQSGFRRGHSTQTALLDVLNDIRLALDKRMITALVLFDFSKAFDTVPHALLLQKLRRLRCSDPALAWFYDYLHGRLQAVIDEGGTTADWIKVTAGVPQGSVLGPLLFIVFINDLPSILMHSRHMIFAEDTQIYHSFFPADLDQGIKDISEDAEAVAKWARDNGLSFNLAKTKAPG